jgi:hypothetical protein
MCNYRTKLYHITASDSVDKNFNIRFNLIKIPIYRIKIMFRRTKVSKISILYNVAGMGIGCAFIFLIGRGWEQYILSVIAQGATLCLLVNLPRVNCLSQFSSQILRLDIK